MGGWAGDDPRGYDEMFVQVFQGRVTDPAAMRAALDRWASELAPGADGWQGSTAGVTADGRFIAFAGFASAEQARRNSDRPEQDRWWAETSKLFDGEVTFHDSDDVYEEKVGRRRDAGFVQVMQGRGTDPDRARELMSERPDDWRAFRPDVLGSITAQYGDGEFATAIYFTNEAEAREYEAKEPPPELKAQMDELNSLAMGPPEFFDLTDPWIYTP
ncbi:MAG TPA: hypothetical protein VGJ44_04020 [Kribbellaceae bacterium]